MFWRGGPHGGSSLSWLQPPLSKDFPSLDLATGVPLPCRWPGGSWQPFPQGGVLLTRLRGLEGSWPGETWGGGILGEELRRGSSSLGRPLPTDPLMGFTRLPLPSPRSRERGGGVLTGGSAPGDPAAAAPPPTSPLRRPARRGGGVLSLLRGASRLSGRQADAPGGREAPVGLGRHGAAAAEGEARRRRPGRPLRARSRVPGPRWVGEPRGEGGGRLLPQGLWQEPERALPPGLGGGGGRRWAEAAP